MPKSLKIISFTACGLIVLLVIGIFSLPLLLNSGSYKLQLQEKIAAALGLEASIGGELAITFLPGLQFTMNDLHIVKEGTDVVVVKQLSLGIDLLPLLHKEVRINNVAVQNPVIFLERYEDGTYNIRKPKPHVILKLDRILVAGATLQFKDAISGSEYAVSACNLDLHGLRPLHRESLDHIPDLDITASLVCAEVRKNALTMTDLNFSAEGKKGLLNLKPVTMHIFGAQGEGNLQADFSGAVPQYQISYSLPQFLIEDFFKTLAPQKSVEGTMDFSTNLTLRGKTLAEVKQTMTGTILLRGENLSINGTDLDEQFARFESSQNFNLVDAGAFLFAGPLGLVVTKGYNFANIFLDTGTSSEIRAVVSDWTVEAGVAQAKDVAMTTNENRIALKGGLDFYNEQFKDVTIALLDDDGCARVEQAIQGSFQNPEIEKPNVLRSLAGPVITLLQKLVPADDCEVFYSGSLETQK